MIGNKLYNLLGELSKTQRKGLLYVGLHSSDKRYRLFREMLLVEHENLEDFNDVVFSLIKSEWPSIDEEEAHLKARRLCSFLAKEVEDFLIVDFLRSEVESRSYLLAKAIEKNGNTNLIGQYYTKSYKESKSKKAFYNQILSLQGNLRMAYAEQNDKKLKEALSLNLELLKLHTYVHNDRLTDYYYNLSNIYLEKKSLLTQGREEITEEITKFLSSTEHPLNGASLYISLAKLNFENEQMDEYLQKAKLKIEEVSTKDKRYKDLYRKIRFLELRLKFFSGANLDTLTKIADDTVKNFSTYSIINNNTIFYKILFLVLEDKLTQAKDMMSSNRIYFRKEDDVIMLFLNAMISYKECDKRKAVRLLQELMYVKNYFFAMFSRFLFMKIQFERDRTTMIEPIIRSTIGLIKNNETNSLGYEANCYLLKCYQSVFEGKDFLKIKPPVNISVLHELLLP